MEEKKKGVSALTWTSNKADNADNSSTKAHKPFPSTKHFQTPMFRSPWDMREVTA